MIGHNICYIECIQWESIGGSWEWSDDSSWWVPSARFAIVRYSLPSYILRHVCVCLLLHMEVAKNLLDGSQSM